MIKFAHIIYCPITGVGIWGCKSEEWLKYRLEVFKKYTLQSLLNQSNRAFLLWLSFRPEEKNHLLIDELGSYLKLVKMPTIMTFHGLMYNDDKFTKGFINRIMNMGRIIRQAWWEQDWKQLLLCFSLFKDKNASLLKRLEKALYELNKINEFKDANYIYVTRIDSDDMFHREAIAEIQTVQPFDGALIYKKGYVYNSETKELAEWVPKNNPPFHTIIFLGSRFFNPLEHLRYYKDFKSHEDIPRCFKTKELSDFKYCVLIHKQHISTHWNHEFRGQKVDLNLINQFYTHMILFVKEKNSSFI